MRALISRLACAAVFVATIFACSDDQPHGSNGRGNLDAPDDEGPGESDEPVPPGKFVTLTDETMNVGGHQRRYILAKPTDYDANKSYPLVISFHGNPGTADGMASGLPFDSASKTAAIIAYPQAATSDWDLYEPTDTNRDMAFVRALPDEIATKVSVDASKIFGFGYSGGGFFITQFTCRFGGVFKAISVNAGGGPDEAKMGYAKYDNGCYKCPGGPIATLVTHGDADPEVSWESGEFTHNCYATFNGCSDSLSAAAPTPCQKHDGCPADKPVKWCLIPGEGHALWPKAMTEAWAFFSGLP